MQLERKPIDNMKKTVRTILYVFLILLAVLLVGFTALVVWGFFSLDSSGGDDDGYTYMGRGDYSEVLFGDVSFFRTSSVDGAITRGGSTELDGYIFSNTLTTPRGMSPLTL